MGGDKYWKELTAAIHNAKLDVKRLTFDIFTPVNEEFVREIAAIGIQVVFYICPDSGSSLVRQIQGRDYSNQDLLDSIELCHHYNIPVTVFFSSGMAGEDNKSINVTWELWDDICSLGRASVSRGSFQNMGQQIPTPITSPVSIDPGSLAFDYPDDYRYRLTIKSFEDYIEAFSKPSWHQWINYETDLLNRDEIVDQIFRSMDYAVYEMDKYGIYDNANQARADRYGNYIDKIAVQEVDNIMKYPDRYTIKSRLICLREAIDSIFQPTSRKFDDRYGYREMIIKKLAVYRPIRDTHK
jgi:hypothetical protein